MMILKNKNTKKIIDSEKNIKRKTSELKKNNNNF